jgi:type II secretory pathway component GspD/PulD (secretin)
MSAGSGLPRPLQAGELRESVSIRFGKEYAMNRSTSRDTFALANRCIACVLMGLALTQLSACVEKVSHTTQYGMEASPVVSASAEQDAAAFQETHRALEDVRWSVLEKKGPKPAWEQLDVSHKGQPARSSLSTPSPATQPAAPAIIEGYSKVAQDVTIPVISENGLPVQVVPLVDGRLRIIWNLRNFGGASVASSRDPNTARRTVAVTPADLAPLAAAVQQQIGASGTVTPLPQQNTLIVTCEPQLKSPVLDLLSRLDVPPRQVEISARIFEVSRDFDFQQGARVLARHIGKDNSQLGLSAFDTQQALGAISSATPYQGSVISLMKNFESIGLSVDTSFQLLADAGLIRVVSSPRMTVAAGQTGYMLAGQELPIQTANLANNILQTSTTYKPVGVQLYITPEAVGPDRVKLHTISIVSSVSGFAPLPTLSGDNPTQFLVNPVIESREAETAVTIADGSTLVISGLRTSRITTREQKVPGLGDLPILGWMFKNHRSQQQFTDLYFFVTPTLLKV